MAIRSANVTNNGISAEVVGKAQRDSKQRKLGKDKEGKS